MEIIIFISIAIFIVGFTVLTISLVEPHMPYSSIAILRTPKSKRNDINDINALPDCYFSNVSTYCETTDYGESNIRVMFFSDLHAEYCFVSPERIISTIKNEINCKRPIDAVIFGGDICDHLLNISIGTAYLHKISEACAKMNIPFLGVTGNHDIGIEDIFIKDAGFIDLRDNFFRISSSKTKDVYVFTGVDDSDKKKRIWYDCANLTKAIRPEDDVSKIHNVLISHNPDWLLHKAEDEAIPNIEHMLSGHIHGGQMRLPFGIEFRVLRGDKLPRKGIINGVFDGYGTSFFISRGIGCGKLPFRLFARPEYTIVEFK